VFVTVGVGKSVELYEDVASVHDLSSGGVFKVQTKGLIPFAEEGSTDLKGTISYHSNTLAVNVDGQLAAAVNKAVKLDKRSIVSDCSAEQLKNATDALQLCSTLATTAATAALTGSATKYVTFHLALSLY
jgi:deuterolysin